MCADAILVLSSSAVMHVRCANAMLVLYACQGVQMLIWFSSSCSHAETVHVCCTGICLVLQTEKQSCGTNTVPALSCELHRTVHAVTLDQICAYAVTAWIAGVKRPTALCDVTHCTQVNVVVVQVQC